MVIVLGVLQLIKLTISTHPMLSLVICALYNTWASIQVQMITLNPFHTSKPGIVNLSLPGTWQVNGKIEPGTVLLGRLES